MGKASTTLWHRVAGIERRNRHKGVGRDFDIEPDDRLGFVLQFGEFDDAFRDMQRQQGAGSWFVPQKGGVPDIRSTVGVNRKVKHLGAPMEARGIPYDRDARWGDFERALG